MSALAGELASTRPSAPGPITAINFDAAHVSYWREAAISTYDDAVSLKAR